MRRGRALLCVVLLAMSSCRWDGRANDAGRILALERAALDRWGKGDPGGYLETFAPEITYFDPMVSRRLNGLTAVQHALAATGKGVRVDRFEMIDPQVKRYGEVAVLTFNLEDLVATPGTDTLRLSWNSTEVYRRLNGSWRIIHSHWSLTGPPASR